MTESSTSASLAEALLEKLTTRTARVGVVGLGYVGCRWPSSSPAPASTRRASTSTRDKVAAINRGESYIQDVPTARRRRISVRAGASRATTRPGGHRRRLDTINICVPTPLRKTKDPDLSYVVSAVEMIAEHLRPGQLVVLESTTYPGTTDEVVRPILERGGLVAGDDFFLAFSPERVDPGNAKWTTQNVPKVVGGMTPDVHARSPSALYAASIDTVVEVSSPKVAEMVKLLENTFRAVNIGLVNELALMCDRLGISVWEVVDAAATKPFGFMPFYPGPGLGGHCIPIDPFYLSWKVKEVGFEARFIELAGHVNGAMPHHVVDKVGDALNAHRKAVRGSQVLVLGVAYKRDIDDIRESPALDVMAALAAEGRALSATTIRTCRRVAARDWPGGVDLSSVPSDDAALAAADCVVILTDHKVFDYDLIRDHARLIVDSRNAIKTHAAHVFKLGAPSAATTSSSQK